MILKFRTSADVPSSEITPEDVYKSRREFMKAVGVGAMGAVATVLPGGNAWAQDPFAAAKKSLLSVDEKVDPRTAYDRITTYNNYYEFTIDKEGVWKLSGGLKTKPWTVKVDGLVAKPGNYGVEDLVNFNQLEERVYRHRCVEKWSMAIPWIGVSLSEVLKKVQPQPGAKFVEFTTVERPGEMPGLSSGVLPWPYVEGLRMDEAMHPLTMMVVGLYGKVLPNQNGAPLRVHIPWKYGFKSGKSIVRIRLTDRQPRTTWAAANPPAYGFYANVNPMVDRPWDQSRERRLPSPFENRQTLIFNGYADQVASLYSGMDLAKYY
jgi:sulfoxide reductase catalytic subunit YedY